MLLFLVPDATTNNRITNCKTNQYLFLYWDEGFLYIFFEVLFYHLFLKVKQNEVPLSTLLEVVNTVRSFGNRCFKQSRYWNAKDRYKQASVALKKPSSLFVIARDFIT